MNINNNVYFITLAECLNFTDAAKRCYITQTAMSRYIASLENHLGVKLFVRDAHNVSLTDAGVKYYHGIKNILSNFNSLEQEIKNIGIEFQGSIRIGIGLYEYSYVEDLLMEFIYKNPKLKIEVYRSTYRELIDRLKSGDMDILVVSEYCSKSFHSKEINVYPMFTGKNLLFMNQEIKDKYMKCAVREILKKENLITNSEDFGPYSDENFKLMLENVVGFVPDKLVQTNSLQVQLKLIKMGYGVSLLPDFLKEVKEFNFASIELVNDNCEQYQFISLKKNMNPVIKELKKYLWKEIEKDEKQK